MPSPSWRFWHDLESKNFDIYDRVGIYTDEGGFVGSIPHTRLPLYEELVVETEGGTLYFTMGDCPPDTWKINRKWHKGAWPHSPELWWVWMRDLKALNS